MTGARQRSSLGAVLDVFSRAVLHVLLLLVGLNGQGSHSGIGASHGPLLARAQVEREQGPPYTTCGPTCQQQVKILEGFILLVILGFAVGVGVCCIKAIDTPMSRIGTGSGSHHHGGDHHYQAGGAGPSGRSKKRD